MATLEGKRVLIFGGTAGIGYGVAEACLKSLASEVTVVSSNSERVSKAVEQLIAGKFGPGTVRGDTIDAKDQPKLKDYVRNFGEVDHIVWSSGDGIKPGMAFQNLDIDVAKSVFDVRFWGPVIVAKNARFRPGGSFTLTAGIVIFKPRASMSVIGGAAGAIDTLTRGLAVDLAPVRVNVVCPGLIETELLESFFPTEEQKKAAFDAILDKMLVKHIGQPHETAEAYLYLMKCTYVTGQSLIVDGGHVIA